MALSLKHGVLRQIRAFATKRTVFPSNLEISRVVKEALNNGKPVVALESTIISHGMPWPQNLECAKEVEDVVRKNNAVPATIAVLDGKIKVGLEDGDLEKFSEGSKSGKVMKCSRRDLPFAVMKGISGGTTVAATMYISYLAGIKVFATGGCGGVHRNAFGKVASLDVSADLIELGRTPVAVVSSGIKSILDIGQSLEFLETQGVIVSTLRENSSSTKFPSFFTDSSDFESPIVLKSIQEAAEMIKTSSDLMLENGMLIAVPNPQPANEKVIKDAIALALAELNDKKVSGKSATPFLLKKVNELTKGSSLASNLALIKHNAAIASKIACRLHEISSSNANVNSSSFFINSGAKQNIFVVGGANEDITIRSVYESYLDGSSNPSKFHVSLGGVGRNMASAIGRLIRAKEIKDFKVSFVSCVGDDSAAKGIRDNLARDGVDVSRVKVSSKNSTGRYIEQVERDSGELIRAFADMEIASEVEFSQVEADLGKDDLIVVDANLSEQFYSDMFSSPKVDAAKVCFETTSVKKCSRIIPSATEAILYLSKLDLLTPNEVELAELNMILMDLDIHEPLQELLTKKGSLLLEKRGKKGSRLIFNNSEEISFSPRKVDPKDIVNTRGCGDTFTAGFIVAHYLLRLDHQRCLDFATQCAQETLKSSEAVAPCFRNVY